MNASKLLIAGGLLVLVFALFFSTKAGYISFGNQQNSQTLSDTAIAEPNLIYEGGEKLCVQTVVNL